MIHESLAINPPRSLRSEEQDILNLLLSADFQGREELLSQTPSVRVSEECTDCRSIKLTVDGKHSTAAIVKRRIPINAEAEDSDNMKIHILLHVVQGFMDEIEIYREDLQNVTAMPKPETLVLVSLDDDHG
jgi:hypothetical protein